MLFGGVARNFHLVVGLTFPDNPTQSLQFGTGKEHEVESGYCPLMSGSRRIMEDTINVSQKKVEQVTDCIRKYKLKINYPL